MSFINILYITESKKLNKRIITARKNIKNINSNNSNKCYFSKEIEEELLKKLEEIHSTINSRLYKNRN